MHYRILHIKSGEIVVASLVRTNDSHSKWISLGLCISGTDSVVKLEAVKTDLGDKMTFRNLSVHCTYKPLFMYIFVRGF